jgi:large subunit ribosomal protein L22
MEVRAKQRYVRISPQKVRMIVDAIKGKPAEAAINALKFMPQKSAGIVEKIVRSAVANADQNTSIDVDDLIVRNLIVDQGPSLETIQGKGEGKRCAHT